MILETKEDSYSIIYRDTCNHIYENIKDNLINIIEKKNEINDIGENIVKESMHTNELIELYKKYHNNKKPNTDKNYNDFFNHLDLIKIGNEDLTIEQALNIALDIFKEDPNKIYGFMLTGYNPMINKNIKINLFHPIVSMELIKLKKANEPLFNIYNNFSLILYSLKETYKNYIVKNDLDMEKNNFKYEIIDLLISLEKKTTITTKIENIKQYNKDKKLLITYDIEYIDSNTLKVLDIDDVTKNIGYVVPIQLLNKSGVAYPYYGSLFSKGGLAWNLTPMFSANISKPYESQSKYLYGSRICTKLGDSKTIQGVSALNHSNLTSPLNSIILNKGFFEYGYEALLTGLKIMFDEKIINDIVDKRKKDITEVKTWKTFLSENEKATQKDYFEYLKQIVLSNEELEPNQNTIEDNIEENILPNNSIAINNNEQEDIEDTHKPEDIEITLAIDDLDIDIT